LELRACPEDWGSLYGPFIKDGFKSGIVLPVCSVIDLALALTVACLIVMEQTSSGPEAWGIVALAAVLASAALCLSITGALDPERRRFLQWMHATSLESDPWLPAQRAIKEVAKSAGLAEPPRLCLIDSDSVNAFVAGEPPARGDVLVTRGLLERFDHSELRGVFAHLVVRYRRGTPPPSEFGFSDADAEAVDIIGDPLPLLHAIEKTAGCASRIEWDSLGLYRLMAVPFDDDDATCGAMRNRSLRNYRVRRLREAASDL